MVQTVSLGCLGFYFDKSVTCVSTKRPLCSPFWLIDTLEQKSNLTPSAVAAVVPFFSFAPDFNHIPALNYVIG